MKRWPRNDNAAFKLAGIGVIWSVHLEPDPPPVHATVTVVHVHIDTSDPRALDLVRQLTATQGPGASPAVLAISADAVTTSQRE